MATPQPGILSEGESDFVALEYSLPTRTRAGELAAAVAAITAGEIKAGQAVLALGPRALALLGSELSPPGMMAFSEIGSGEHIAPSTQRDLLIWAKARGRDDAFDIARSCHTALSACADLELETPGFTYHDSRDLTGFIDGTANPKGDAIAQAALLSDEGPHAGGSFVLTQKWRTDLQAFHALSVPEQEAVIGRTKEDSIELEGDEMPSDSHVSRTDVSVGGVAQKIWRRSYPYGGVSEHGLYFLAFACEISRFDVLLRRMFGTSEDGIHDHLIDFTTPLTGSYWFAPSLDRLTSL